MNTLIYVIPSEGYVPFHSLLFSKALPAWFMSFFKEDLGFLHNL